MSVLTHGAASAVTCRCLAEPKYPIVDTRLSYVSMFVRTSVTLVLTPWNLKLCGIYTCDQYDLDFLGNEELGIGDCRYGIGLN